MKFDNATLNKVWTRIVTATTALCGSIGGTGFRHVHDALIAYTGLKRSTTASTPGDYLKGIARCARHIGGGTASANTLAEIADLLEIPKSFSVTVHEYTDPVMWIFTAERAISKVVVSVSVYEGDYTGTYRPVGSITEEIDSETFHFSRYVAESAFPYEYFGDAALHVDLTFYDKFGNTAEHSVWA